MWIIIIIGFVVILTNYPEEDCGALHYMVVCFVTVSLIWFVIGCYSTVYLAASVDWVKAGKNGAFVSGFATATGMNKFN